MNLYVIIPADRGGWQSVPDDDMRLLLAPSDEAALRTADFYAACHEDAGGTGNPSLVFLAVENMRCVGSAHAERHEHAP